MKRSLIASCALPGLLAGCASVQAPQDTSWGKAGVSYAAYRTDAVECASQGARTDMSGQAAFKDVMGGTREQDAILANQQSADPLTDYVMIQRRNYHVNIPELQQYLVSAVASCLRSRGYSQFVLTPAQSKQLAQLRKGSEERFRFLYRLASDRDVVAGQALVRAPS